MKCRRFLALILVFCISFSSIIEFQKREIYASAVVAGLGSVSGGYEILATGAVASGIHWDLSDFELDPRNESFVSGSLSSINNLSQLIKMRLSYAWDNFFTDDDKSFLQEKSSEYVSTGKVTYDYNSKSKFRSINSKVINAFPSAQTFVPSSIVITADSLQQLVRDKAVFTTGYAPVLKPWTSFLSKGFRIKMSDGTIYTASVYSLSNGDVRFILTTGANDYYNSGSITTGDVYFTCPNSTGFSFGCFSDTGVYNNSGVIDMYFYRDIYSGYGITSDVLSLFSEAVAIQFDDNPFLTPVSDVVSGTYDGVIPYSYSAGTLTGESAITAIDTAIDTSITENNPMVVIPKPIDELIGSDVGTLVNDGTVSGAGALEDLLGGISSDTSDINTNVKGIKGLLSSLLGVVSGLKADFVGDTDINFDALKSGNFSKKFPFCIPFDFYHCITQLVAPSVAPVFTLSFAGTIMSSAGDIVIDMSKFDSLAKIIRFFVFFGFVAGLIKLTRQLIKG